MLSPGMSAGSGSPVWRHFPVHETQPAPYSGLEDGRDDVCERLVAIAIRPGNTDTGELEFRSIFPASAKAAL